MTLEVYLQPFVAVGDYSNIRQFTKPKTFEFEPVVYDRESRLQRQVAAQQRGVPLGVPPRQHAVSGVERVEQRRHASGPVLSVSRPPQRLWLRRHAGVDGEVQLLARALAEPLPVRHLSSRRILSQFAGPRVVSNDRVAATRKPDGLRTTGGLPPHSPTRDRAISSGMLQLVAEDRHAIVAGGSRIGQRDPHVAIAAATGHEPGRAADAGRQVPRDLDVHDHVRALRSADQSRAPARIVRRPRQRRGRDSDRARGASGESSANVSDGQQQKQGDRPIAHGADSIKTRKTRVSPRRYGRREVTD